MRLQKAVQNLPTNIGPWSDKMFLGNPWIREMLWSITSAVCLAEGNFGNGMKRAILENLSTTFRIVVFPSDKGKPVTKSREMYYIALLSGPDRE